MTIVKVQVPLFVAGATRAGPVGGCLVYEQERRRTVEQAISKATFAALNGEPKGYFEAEWHAPRAVWLIGKRVEAQPW